MSRGKKSQPSGPSVPTYIVTFSDMVTLLLTFFVMLLSMADTQVEDHKYAAGQSSFRRAVADFGLSGFLINQSSGPQFEHPKPLYRVEEGNDEPEDRSVDAKTEMLRRILLDIEEKMKISPSHITGVSRTFLPTEVRFARGSWKLSEEDKRRLVQYWRQIQDGLTGQQAALYVLGLANDEKDYNKQMILSARRAQAVAEVLRTLQTKDMTCPIYCWGAGDGGEWTGKTGLTNPSTQVMIAVLIETK